MSLKRNDDIIPVVESCRNRWDSYNVAEREEVLKDHSLPMAEAWYVWSALKEDTRNAIIADEMDYLAGKHQEGYHGYGEDQYDR